MSLTENAGLVRCCFSQQKQAMYGVRETWLWFGCLVCLVAVLGANDKEYEPRRELGGGSRRKKGWIKVENNGNPIDLSQFIGQSDVLPPQTQERPKHRRGYPSVPKPSMPHESLGHALTTRKKGDDISQPQLRRQRAAQRSRHPVESRLPAPAQYEAPALAFDRRKSAHLTGYHMQATTSDKVFCLGQRQTYERSLRAMFAMMAPQFRGKSICFSSCSGLSWAHSSKRQVSDSLTFTKHSVFIDGAAANYPWLDKHFSNSRFVLNSRPLLDWLVAVHGYYVEAGGNKNEHKFQLARDLCLTSRRQTEIIAYFSEYRDRRNRFTVIDASGDIKDTMTLLRWVTRSELDAYSTDTELVLSVNELPNAAATAFESDVQIPKRLQREDQSQNDMVGYIKDVLLSFGCRESHFRALLYAPCAEAMASTCTTLIETEIGTQRNVSTSPLPRRQ